MNLNAPFTAHEVYVTFGGRMHYISDDIECKDWLTLEQGLRDLYPDYDRIEFATFDRLENGQPDFSTLEDWEIVTREGQSILFKVVDCE